MRQLITGRMQDASREGGLRYIPLGSANRPVITYKDDNHCFQERGFN